MTTAASRFDMLKLTLTRLNMEWSPAGDTFSHQAAAMLRAAVWNEGSMLNAVMQLWCARAYLERQWASMIDTTQLQPHEIRDSSSLRRWDETMQGCTSHFDELESYLSRDCQDKLAKHIYGLYKKLY